MKYMSMEYIVRQIHRCEWAADTTDDYKWAKQHLINREYFIRLLLDKFNIASVSPSASNGDQGNWKEDVGSTPT